VDELIGGLDEKSCRTVGVQMTLLLSFLWKVPEHHLGASAGHFVYGTAVV
jgi:hypothetical protein